MRVHFDPSLSIGARWLLQSTWLKNITDELIFVDPLALHNACMLILDYIVSGDFSPVYFNNFRLLLRYVVPVVGIGTWLLHSEVKNRQMNVKAKPMLRQLMTSEP